MSYQTPVKVVRDVKECTGHADPVRSFFNGIERISVDGIKFNGFELICDRNMYAWEDVQDHFDMVNDFADVLQVRTNITLVKFRQSTRGEMQYERWIRVK